MASNSLAVYTPDQQQKAIELLGYHKHSRTHLELLFRVAEHYRLDVLTREITLIPGKGPFIGVWGRLHVAHRSGHLDGLEMDDEWETDSGLYCVRCVVWRNDMGHPAAKVIGRVGKAEKKDWPFEIARARAVRAALGFAFSIHDAYDHDTGDDNDAWVPPPDEPMAADGTPVDPTTGEVTTQPEPEPAPVPAPKPKKRRATPPPPPDEPPPTIQVGGHTLAQRIAIAARDAGIDDDDTRHDVIAAATNGKYRRGSDVPDDDQAAINRIMQAFAGLKDGTLELRYLEDGTPRLYWRKEATTP